MINEQNKSKIKKDCFNIPYTILQDENLSQLDINVFNTIANFADNETHTAYISQSTIQNYARVSKNTLIKALKNLEEKNYLRIEEQFDKKTGLRIESKYILNYDNEIKKFSNTPIRIAGINELAEIAEVGKIYEWTDKYNRIFKVEVTDIEVNMITGKITVELKEIWQ